MCRSRTPDTVVLVFVVPFSGTREGWGERGSRHGSGRLCLLCSGEEASLRLLFQGGRGKLGRESLDARQKQLRFRYGGAGWRFLQNARWGVALPLAGANLALFYDFV